MTGTNEKLRLYTVTLETEMVVLARTLADAEWQALQARNDEESWEISARPMDADSLLPPDWDDESVPHGRRLSEAGAPETIADLIAAGHVHDKAVARGHSQANESCPWNDPETFANPATRGLPCTCEESSRSNPTNPSPRCGRPSPTPSFRRKRST